MATTSPNASQIELSTAEHDGTANVKVKKTGDYGWDTQNSLWVKKALDPSGRAQTAGDFMFLVEQGLVPGASVVHIQGHNPSVGTAFQTVWEESSLYVFPSSASTMTVSSSSASDTSAGTGLRTVTVSGLDSNYNQISEVVTLNGQTGVTTANSYLRVNNLTGATAGSGGSNAGIIYIGTGSITGGKPATVYNEIAVGDNISHSGFYTVPNGLNAYMVYISMGIASGKTAEFVISMNTQGGLVLNSPDFVVFQTITTIPRYFQKISSKSDINLKAKVDATTGDGSFTMRLLLL